MVFQHFALLTGAASGVGRATARLFAREGAAVSGVDVLDNIAGVNRFSLFSELGEEEWDLLFGVNLKGAAFMAQAALPRLVERSGAIVDVASTAAWSRGPGAEAPDATRGPNAGEAVRVGRR